MKLPSYSIGNGEQWRYHGIYQDQWRHDQKVKEAVKANLADMVSDEHITIADGRRVINVPLPELKEFRISFDWHHVETVGQTDDNATGNHGEHKNSMGTGKEGGTENGADVEDTAVTLEEAADIVFERLALPDLDPLKRSLGDGRELQPESWDKVGLKSRWVRRATLREAMKRHVKEHQERLDIQPTDVRYWRYEALPADEGGAVVLAMMDTSGSMGTFEKYLAKSFFFWTVEFLRRNYPHVELVFLAHDVRAREVDEETFFHRGSSGGTVSSSVYRLGLDILEQRYPAEQFNSYAFHFTDGGNLTSDNALAVEIGMELARRTNLFGYGEIHDTDRNPSPLFQSFQERQGIGAILLRRKEDVFRALEYYFGKDGEKKNAHTLQA
ncbi:hypothetical protein SAMN00768000_3448 [Sulfobacillus thermosulfidooxidans DSM 9293]|uniref:Sporulation protein YhbH n=1 Tax=Sulfobacillus thermosulfidooxidans (strain DSM 9293 / VKM B-1269 / AT-1) TaxID=929705 RepID=A0A1W1WMP3_SULTA|nr:DUF444 family protein [Sulfobacillus thermosulfidooxidans]SMC07567.1 hypothetical protein SAMN00768000_3448 [Sulfobacillus thermosulfidooxidans DSM 9293]